MRKTQTKARCAREKPRQHQGRKNPPPTTQDKGATRGRQAHWHSRRLPKTKMGDSGHRQHKAGTKTLLSTRPPSHVTRKTYNTNVHEWPLPYLKGPAQAIATRSVLALHRMSRLTTLMAALVQTTRALLPRLNVLVWARTQVVAKARPPTTRGGRPAHGQKRLRHHTTRSHSSWGRRDPWQGKHGGGRRTLATPFP